MFKSVRVLMFGGIFGKLLALVRESVSAALFGTGIVASAYRISQAAFLIPVQGLMSEALASGFTPTYAMLKQHDQKGASTLLAAMQIALLVFTGIIATLLIIFAGRWVQLLAPGFAAPEMLLATRMVQIMGLIMPPYALTALYASAELAAGKASMAAARATAQSAGLIGGTVAASLADQPLFIPIGFCLSYFALTCWGLMSLKAKGLKWTVPRDQWRAAASALGRVWSAYRILIIVPLIMQAHFIVERRVASVVNVRAVAALDYARFISDTAVLLLATPFALAGLAAMSVAPESEFRSMARRSLRLLIVIGVPISAGLVVHAVWLIRVAYARGAFDSESVSVTSTILQTLSIGLWAQLVGYAGARFLSARGRNRQVLTIYTVAVIANILLNVTLGPRIGVAALGLAFAANSIILGVSVMWELRLLAPLSGDLAMLLVAAVSYAAIWSLVPRSIALSLWAPPACFAVYWVLIFGLIDRLRTALSEAIRTLSHDKG